MICVKALKGENFEKRDLQIFKINFRILLLLSRCGYNNKIQLGILTLGRTSSGNIKGWRDNYRPGCHSSGKYCCEPRSSFGRKNRQRNYTQHTVYGNIHGWNPLPGYNSPQQKYVYGDTYDFFGIVYI